MSRLIVKNLPKKISEDKLRELFGQNGTVTDVQLKYTQDGNFRRFGFIGFQNESEAEAAVKLLNNTFINTSRITVEHCAALGDEKKPKAWSKYAPDSTAFKKANRVESVTETVAKEKPKKKKKQDESIQLLEKYKDDPEFEEFLQVHAPEEAKKLHSLNKNNSENRIIFENSALESGMESENPNNSGKDELQEVNKIANEQISDLEYMKALMKTNDGSEKKPRQKMEKMVKEKITLFTVKVKDLPYNIKKKDIKDFFKPVTAYSIRIPRLVHGFAYVGFKDEKSFKKALIKDRSFINGKRISVVKFISNNKSEGDAPRNPLKNKWQSQEEALKNEENVAESGKIFIRNLAYTTTEEDIENLFSKYGSLSEVNLPVDSSTRKMKGFGTVTFLMPEHAVKAYSELDGSILHGRMLHLLPGKSKDTTEDANLEESTNFKKKKSAKLKSQAGSSHNWNSLFLGHDAVADAIADTYGTTKEAVVGPEGKGSAAVRLALGETQIVAQTRKYLEQQGVVLDAFKNMEAKRSKTIILVKNLPSMTEAREIVEIFKKHGEIGRVILPPSGITAIVEFLEPSEARKAFTKLAYSKFKNVPLYLEWAPENSLMEGKANIEEGKSIGNVEEENNKQLDENKEQVEEEEEEEPESDTTLFIKNLNFKTTDEALRKHFEQCGKIHYANVATKRDPKDPKNSLSMGYGFVRFTYKAGADKALKTLQQSVLDGKSLELKRSERTMKNEVTAKRKTIKTVKQTGNKILIRNVPFQATKREIQELFSTFGEIKALRLPKKMTVGSNSHRGFAFVDYTTASDAKAAFEALCQSTHLYGRRLVLEWASGEEGVEEIRKRTAHHFKPTEEVKSKKSVFSVN